ncbi:complement C2-like [Liolophura sinensis]|uniref:complement C2-like n=1 Tax=Liolophura sinensis TaxID=3198878 RepID=UPI003158D174
MRCLVHGEWDVGFGNCEAVRCRPPESVFMGTHYPVKDSYNYQESVTYQCLENHEVIGPATLTCDRYGEWSGYTPYCRAVTCPDPSQPEHGRRIGSSFFVGDTVKFKCMTGFTLMGSQNRTCLPNAQWSGVLTICEKGDSDCPDPGTPIGAVKVGKSYNIGDTVTFTCGSDFFLEGSANRVCLKNGMWSGTETYCRYKYSYRDPEEAAILFGEKLDQISIETSDSKLGAKLRENLTLVHDNSTGRAINIGYQFGVDLYILVDVSGSISSEALNITKEFCKAIVDKVGVSRKIDGTRVTLISFSGNFEELVTLHDEQTPEAVIAKIDEMGKIRGSNATATTLAMERVEDFIASRKIQALGTKALSAVILLTDGKHNMYGSPVAVANRMKTDYGTDMYTIGIGVDVDEEILQNMASPGQYIRLKHIHDLEGITVFLLNGSIGYEECGVGGLKDLPAYQDLEDYVTAKDIQNWPWMAGLYVDGNRDQTYSDFICGASLIRPQWLLTAAHCFPKKKYLYPADWQARMGSLSRVTNDGIPLDIAEIIIHPDYTNTPNEQNDVALIRLVDPVILSPTIRTVCLPNNLPQFEVDQNQAWYKAGRWSVVSGWGDVRVRKPTDSGVILQEELKFTAMRVQSDETCDATKVNPLLRYTQNMYCAGDGKRRDTCAGDSGGPSVVELPVSYQSKRVFQIGIVSWGFGCRQEGMYGYYVRLEKFLPWILEKVDPPQS